MLRTAGVMLRTAGVLAAGMLLSIAVLGSLAWATMASLPWSARVYAYYVIAAVTGAAVGLFVGFLQKRGAGIVALVCILPSAYLQHVNRFSKPATGVRVVFLLVGTAVELGIAFLVANHLKIVETVDDASASR